jgi:hypothetical protein
LRGNKVEEKPAEPKKTEELLGGILRTNSGDVQVEQIEPKKSSPVGFPGFGGDAEGEYKGKTGRRG